MNDRPMPPEGCVDPGRGQALEAYLEGRLAADEEAVFEEHYFRCAACLETIRIRQALPAVLETTPAPGSTRSRWRPAFFRSDRIRGGLAVAATIALVLLAYPAFLGLRRLPRAADEARTLADENARLRAELERTRDTFERQLADLRESSEWTGAVPLVILGRRFRGGVEADETLALRPGQPHAPLALVPVVPDRAADADPFRFELSLKDGRVVWALDMHASEIRRAVRGTTVVTFLVPAALLPPGAHELRLRELQPPDAEPLLEIRFRVERAD
jgi:hypothetical protein